MVSLSLDRLEAAAAGKAPLPALTRLDLFGLKLLDLAAFSAQPLSSLRVLSISHNGVRRH